MRWVAGGFVVLLLIAIPWGLRSEERSLEAETRTALAQAGISSADVSFSGRSGTIVATLDKQEQRAAQAAVSRIGGIRAMTYVLVDSPPPTSTTTTTAPAPTTTTIITAPHTHMSVVLSDTGLDLSGTLPDARTTAAITTAGEFLYGSLLTNTVTVDPDLPLTAWNDAAAEALVVIPMMSRGSLVLNEGGASVQATVSSEAAAERLIDRLQRILGADIPLDAQIEVSTGSLPELSVTLSGDSASLSGVVPGTEIRTAIRAAVAAASEGDVSDGLTVGSDSIATYVLDRSPYLITKLSRGEDATLRIVEHETRGSMVGGTTWKKESSKITKPTSAVLDVLAAAMAGDPSLHLTIEIHSSSAKTKTGNVVLSSQRVSAVQAALFRSGVDPARLQVVSGKGSGELLRFKLSPADQDK
ncbi:MAG: OmpA family protein [Acidimicrobiia bacterium]